jgi:hypothetical protein
MRATRTCTGKQPSSPRPHPLSVLQHRQTGSVPERFIVDIPLEATPRQRRVLGIRFQVGAMAYNRALGLFLGRLRVMRADPRWAAARELPKREQRAQYTP